MRPSCFDSSSDVIRVGARDYFDPGGYVSLRSEFGARTLRDRQKARKILLRPLRTLSDVRRDRNRRPPHLVTEPKLPRFASTTMTNTANSQPSATHPDLRMTGKPSRTLPLNT